MVSGITPSRTCVNEARGRDIHKPMARRGQSLLQKENQEGQDNHTSVNLDEDIEEEGRDPDRTFKIDGLNENKIRRWWNGFNKTSWSWRQNCCKTVKDGLLQGGSDIKRRLVSLMYIGTIWMPHDVVRYCRFSYKIIKLL